MFQAEHSSAARSDGRLMCPDDFVNDYNYRAVPGGSDTLFERGSVTGRPPESGMGSGEGTGWRPVPAMWQEPGISACERLVDQFDPVPHRRLGAGLQMGQATDIGRHDHLRVGRLQVLQLVVAQLVGQLGLGH